MSCAHCEVLNMPSMGSPTARITSSSPEKPGPNSVMSLDRPGTYKLLDEVDAHATGQERCTPHRLGGAQLGQLGTVVQLVEGGVGLLHHLAFVEALEPGQRILACRVVGRHQGNVLETLVGHDLANRLVHVVVLVGRTEKVRVALRTGILRWAGIGADVEGLGLENGLHPRPA
jgi:hypothetical protein